MQTNQIIEQLILDSTDIVLNPIPDQYDENTYSSVINERYRTILNRMDLLISDSQTAIGLEDAFFLRVSCFSLAVLLLINKSLPLATEAIRLTFEVINQIDANQLRCDEKADYLISTIEDICTEYRFQRFIQTGSDISQNYVPVEILDLIFDTALQSKVTIDADIEDKLKTMRTDLLSSIIS